MFSNSYLLLKTVIFMFAATISGFKIQRSRQIARFSRQAISNENTVLIQEQFKSISSIAADKTLDRSQLEIVNDFLIAEGSYLGSLKWKIQVISSSNSSWCYKCTPVGTIGKPVFLKHSRQHLADINDWNKLKIEFEGHLSSVVFHAEHVSAPTTGNTELYLLKCRYESVLEILREGRTESSFIRCELGYSCQRMA
jgi:hypothetical protein